MCGMLSEVSTCGVNVIGSYSTGGDSPAKSMVPSVPGMHRVLGVCGIQSPRKCSEMVGFLGLVGEIRMSLVVQCLLIQLRNRRRSSAGWIFAGSLGLLRMQHCGFQLNDKYRLAIAYTRVALEASANVSDW